MNYRKFASFDDLLQEMDGTVAVQGNEVVIQDLDAFVEKHLDTVVFNAYFSTPDVRMECVELIKKASQEGGVRSESLLPVYVKRGKGELGGFTVPALNVRLMPYDFMRCVLRMARETDTGLFVFEIARSEISYTDQPPSLYAAAAMAAALREGYRYPIFLQGDHFQVNPSKFAEDPGAEKEAICNLIREAVNGGMKNIDIDCSTVVHENASSPEEEQALNAELTAYFTQFIRSLDKGDGVNVGGEIGEIGKRNSTPEDFHAFMKRFAEHLGASEPYRGISKISVQTGTRHGGFILPDGSVARVSVDFNTLRDISRIAREEYGMAGAVQHGASTLPVDLFDKFPEVETAEIHLATQFMNMIFDSQHFPEELREDLRKVTFEIRGHVRERYETDEQFLMSNRKFAIKYLAEDVWRLSDDVKNAILEELCAYLHQVFTRLRVINTRKIVEATYNQREE